MVGTGLEACALRSSRTARLLRPDVLGHEIVGRIVVRCMAATAGSIARHGIGRYELSRVKGSLKIMACGLRLASET